VPGDLLEKWLPESVNYRSDRAARRRLPLDGTAGDRLGFAR
jgi:hypothetical protein